MLVLLSASVKGHFLLGEKNEEHSFVYDAEQTS